MYVQNLEKVTPGAVVAKAVLGERGQTLVAAGTVLTAAYLDSLRKREIPAVYLRDGLADDIQPVEPISEKLRTKVVTSVGQMFAGVLEAADVTSSGGSDRPKTVAQASTRLANSEGAALSTEALEALFGDVENLIGELVDATVIEGLSTLKSHNAYTYQHSVDVAVMGIMLGKRAGLPEAHVRDLALGCLLHDVGKAYIDRAILEKVDRLTPAEYLEVQKHPQMGFELLRRMQLPSILPAHVAYQHHERQDGSGYPQGLTGSNRIARTSNERFDPRRMLLIAEIAAVADVYSAITSHRPYRLATSLDRAAMQMRQMAGKHLNKDGVRLLLATVPAYWVGHWVDVTAGPYIGWRGVVTEISPYALDRPKVRLQINPQREQVADPVELDLRTDQQTMLTSIPPGVHPTQ